MNKKHMYVDNCTALVKFCAMDKKHINVTNCTDGSDVKLIIQHVHTEIVLQLYLNLPFN
jgi:hypothetical protein